MTIRSLYRPTFLDQPVSGHHGWLFLCAAVVSWLALCGLVYLAMSVLTWAVRFFA